MIDTPYTQGLAGWPDGEAATCSNLTFEVENTFGVIVASAAGPKSITETERLLVTAVGRVEPTGLCYVDPSRREVAAPGLAPLLHEPVRGKITWRRKGTRPVKAYALDNTGARVSSVPLETIAGGGVRLILDGKSAGLHWELVVE